MNLRLRTIGAGLVISGICTLPVHAADWVTSKQLIGSILAATTTTFGDNGPEVTQSKIEAESPPPQDAPAGSTPAPAASQASTGQEAKPDAQQPAEEPKAADAGASGSDKVQYTVKEGNKVDEHTLEGWKTWRALDCARCHGANQQGLVGPSLIEALKTMSKEDFKKTVTEGRLPQGMPPFGSVPRLVKNIDNLYTYLKARSDDKVKPGHVYPLDK